MEISSNTTNKQKAVEAPDNTHVLQVGYRDIPSSGWWRVCPGSSGTSTTAPRAVGPVIDPHGVALSRIPH
ncbi:UNVERIFIED_CONTAM: hypothetical protein Slati_0167000 [Sesamum latifolium]|uniref:Uncharacterized protein n=1 Tax=Sesamum latifolium TaxID=2727402 RepID=A0AAW2YAQ1_9LAMI